jgi:hypothetical protein
MIEPRLNLHENDRTGFGFVEQDELQQRFRVFFNQPTRLTTCWNELGRAIAGHFVSGPRASPSGFIYAIAKHVSEGPAPRSILVQRI